MNTDFERKLRNLADARILYEDLRVGQGRYADRVDALTRLHTMRAELARIRYLV